MLYATYRTQQETIAPRSDFWFVDLETDEVVATDVTEECGGLWPSVSTATNGDTYIGTVGVVAMEHAQGLPGSFPPCSVRIRAGTRRLDRSYSADLNSLTGGLPTSGMIPAGNNRALVWAYDTNEMPIDPNLTARELEFLTNWNFYEWELGSEQPATLVESLPTTNAFVDTREFDGRTFLIQFPPDFSTSTLSDLTQRPVNVTYTFSFFTFALSRLSSEPGARMAERIEHRGGLRVLRF